jgi:tRNA-splicing ligase RtcB
MRGIAEESPVAYKELSEIVSAADRAGLAANCGPLEAVICIKG